LSAEDKSSQVKVHSLALNPYEPRDKVATFILEGSFKHLPSPINRWKYAIPKDEHSNNYILLRTLEIFIDSNFEGFTPLNLFESSEEHKIEYVVLFSARILPPLTVKLHCNLGAWKPCVWLI
jgi:hypothetical protein